VRVTKAVSVCACLTVVILGGSPCLAAICSVPSAPYPAVQSAVNDPACTEIVIGAQTFVESLVISRDLTLRGASSSTTVIKGRVTVVGAATHAEVRELRIDTSSLALVGSEALLVQAGAQVTSIDLVVLHGTTLFVDGFEAGDTSAWSRTVP